MSYVGEESVDIDRAGGGVAGEHQEGGGLEVLEPRAAGEPIAELLELPVRYLRRQLVGLVQQVLQPVAEELLVLVPEELVLRPLPDLGLQRAAVVPRLKEETRHDPERRVVLALFARLLLVDFAEVLLDLGLLLRDVLVGARVLIVVGLQPLLPLRHVHLAAAPA